YGYIGRSDWTFTIGGAVYASETAGELTQTEPELTSNVVQPVAYAEAGTLIFFNPWTWRGLASPAFTKHVHLDVAAFKIPAAGAPAVVVQDNIAMLSFNQNDSESAYLRWVIPDEYAGGDLTMIVIWTNDGGVDDNTKNVRWQVNYRDISGAGASIVGSNANSPKTIDDTYTSATGYLIHFADPAAIAAADFAGA
ncbi:unnamed protein product, partial [marine sediment metagenome]